MPMKQLRDIRKDVYVLLKFARRHQKQEHQMDWLTVKGIKLNSFSGAPDYRHPFGYQCSGGMRNPYAKPDTCAHRRLTFSDALGD